jgi:hypothetical protein
MPDLLAASREIVRAAVTILTSAKLVYVFVDVVVVAFLRDAFCTCPRAVIHTGVLHHRQGGPPARPSHKLVE